MSIRHFKVTAIRSHEICAGHRVVGHEGKCRNLHGHGYVFRFYCEAPELDSVGRVIDFGIIKKLLCQWLEDNWDHRMLLWERDPLLTELKFIDNTVVAVPFNPTAENIGRYLLETVGPHLLQGTVKLKRVDVQETIKCSATVEAE